MRSVARFLQFPAALFGLDIISGVAESAPRLSVNDLIDRSDYIVSGTVVRSRAAWDPDHRLIWTHHLLRVSVASKGRPAPEIEIAEPGGDAGGCAMIIPGSQRYSPGDHVLLFIRAAANSYLRTTGWSQGKYLIGDDGRVRGPASGRDEAIRFRAGRLCAGLRENSSLSGKTVAEAHAMIAARACYCPYPAVRIVTGLSPRRARSMQA